MAPKNSKKLLIHLSVPRWHRVDAFVWCIYFYFYTLPCTFSRFDDSVEFGFPPCFFCTPSQWDPSDGCKYVWMQQQLLSATIGFGWARFVSVGEELPVCVCTQCIFLIMCKLVAVSANKFLANCNGLGCTDSQISFWILQEGCSNSFLISINLACIIAVVVKAWWTVKFQNHRWKYFI